MTYDLKDPAYFDPVAVEKELARVIELCDGCRRCYRLCPSFDYMLDCAVDENDGDISKITTADYRRIVDLCWQCKLCYNHCPYTPPHKWNIDFPRLMLRAKASRAKAEGVTRTDAWLGNVDAVGALGCATAPLSNWANDFGPGRAVLEALVGIDRGRKLPRFHHQTFARWFRKRGGGRIAEGPRVAFFFSCSVNYNEPQVGRDAVSVLEKNGCALSCPEQVCCGMPYLDGGDVDAATRNADRNVRALLPLVEQGAKVVVPQPTCSYVLKKEYPMLRPGPDTDKVVAATQDLFEYLAARNREGTLQTEFPGKKPGRIAYQVPCHLRVQNMGFKTRDVIGLIPGTDIHTIESCTAMDGTWGMKKEYFPISLIYAKRVAEKMEAAEPETFMTDCTLSALQIEEARGVRPVHPVTVLREAYGLPEER
jgi:glycerol-3-phosphate dehydrogenase subunit C